MLKRIKYISRIASGLTASEVERIGLEAMRKNEEAGITGILLTGGGFFFQILEGAGAAVDTVWAAIQADPRHQDVLLLATQDGVRDRLFPDWAMKRVNLDDDATAHMETLRAILPVAFEQRRLLDELVGALERGVWHEFATRT
jgi:hypothetical protein